MRYAPVPLRYAPVPVPCVTRVCYCCALYVHVTQAPGDDPDDNLPVVEFLSKYQQKNEEKKAKAASVRVLKKANAKEKGATKTITKR